jgi:hypothetical protein
MPEKRIEDQRQLETDMREQRRVERLVVLELLRCEESERRSPAKLELDLATIPREKIKAAIEGLSSLGVVWQEDGLVWASLCARHLDTLDMLCV